MDTIIISIRKALKEKNWYGALFMAIALPDICAYLEHGTTDRKKYSSWFENNLTKYTGLLSGHDCYSLRCAVLHQNMDDISKQEKRDLDHYIFVTQGTHLNLFKDCFINGIKESFLQLNVIEFCEDICVAVENWISLNSNNQNINNRLKHALEIHEPGYIYKELIKFGVSNNEPKNTTIVEDKNKFVTVFNLECKGCPAKIGQLVSNSVDIEHIECPNCKSKDTTHGTIIQ